MATLLNIIEQKRNGAGTGSPASASGISTAGQKSGETLSALIRQQRNLYSQAAQQMQGNSGPSRTPAPTYYAQAAQQMPTLEQVRAQLPGLQSEAETQRKLYQEILNRNLSKANEDPFSVTPEMAAELRAAEQSRNEATRKYQAALGQNEELSYAERVGNTRTDLSRVAELLEQREALNPQRTARENPRRQAETLEQYKRISAQISATEQSLQREGYSDAEIRSLFSYLTRQRNAAEMEQKTEEWRRSAAERGSLGNLGINVGSGLVSGIGYLDLALQNAFAGEDAITGQRRRVDYNTGAQSAYYRGEATMQGEMDKLLEKYGEADENGEITGMSGMGNFRAGAYQLAVSMGQSAAVAGLTAVGMPAAMLLLSGSAATQTTHEMHEKGFSDGTALLMGGIAGAAEYVTEKIGMDQLFKTRDVSTAKNVLRTTLRNFRNQALAEGGEEVLSTIINTLADVIINGDRSELESRYRELLAQGMTRDQAQRTAAREWLSGVWQDFYMGAISGGLFAAGGMAFQSGRNAVVDARTGRELISHNAVQELMDRIGKVDNQIAEAAGLPTVSENSSARELGAAQRGLTRAQVMESMRAELAARGEENVSPALLSGLYASSQQEEQRLTGEEKKALRGSRTAMELASEWGRQWGDNSIPAPFEGLEDILRAQLENETAPRERGANTEGVLNNGKQSSYAASENGDAGVRAGEQGGGAGQGEGALPGGEGQIRPGMGGDDAQNLRQVTPAGLGIRNGSADSAIRVQSEAALTGEARSAAELVRRLGLEPVAYQGDMIVGGQSVNGYIQDGRIYFRTDARYSDGTVLSPEAIAKHEAVHNAYSSDPGIIEAGMEIIRQGYSEGQVRAMKDDYRETYKSLYDFENMSEAEIQRILEQELVADAYAGMNRFRERGEVAERVREAMPQVMENRNAEAGRQETRANVQIEKGPLASEGDKRTAAYVLSTHIADIEDMNPVRALTGNEMNDRGRSLVDQIRDFFTSVGGQIERDGLGTVYLGEYGVGGILNHKPLNRAKMVTLEAVPDVIRQGRIINYDPNWKGRGYPSLTIAAPVTIGDHTVFVAAVIDQRSGYKFYLNECVDSDGNYVRITEDPSDSTKSGVTVQDGVTRGSEGSSDNSILNSSEKSNTQNEGKASAEVTPERADWRYNINLHDEGDGATITIRNKRTGETQSAQIENGGNWKRNALRARAEDMIRQRIAENQTYGITSEDMRSGLSGLARRLANEKKISYKVRKSEVQLELRHNTNGTWDYRGAVDGKDFFSQRSFETAAEAAMAAEGEADILSMSNAELQEWKRRRDEAAAEREARRGEEPANIEAQKAIGEMVDELTQPAAERAEAVQTVEENEDAAPGVTEDTGGDSEPTEAEVNAAVDTVENALERATDPFQYAEEKRPVHAIDAETRAKVRTEAEKEKKSLGKKASEMTRAFMRSMVNTGDSVHQIAKRTGNKALDGYYFYALAARQRGSEWVAGKRTDINGNVIGTGLNTILDPIRAKGEAYYEDFQMYLLHRLNTERMSRARDTEFLEAQEHVAEMHRQHRWLADMTIDQLTALANQTEYGGDTSEEYLKNFNAGMEKRLLAREYLEARRERDRLERAGNKPVFGWENQITAEESTRTADELLRKHPEFKEASQQIYDYSKDLLQYRVDAGMITQENMNHLLRTYPHYVPVFYDHANKVNAIPAGNVRVSSVIGRAAGGEQAIMPLHKALGQLTMRVMQNAGTNTLGNALLNERERSRAIMDDYIKHVEQSATSFEPDTVDADSVWTPNSDNVITVIRDGERYDVTLDSGMSAAFKAFHPSEINNAGFKVLKAGNDLFKKLCTSYNPLFAVSNFLRDAQDAVFYSTDSARWAVNMPRAYKQIATDGKYWNMWKGMGGVYSSYFDWMTGEAGKESKGLPGKINALNMAIEQAPRLAEFMTVLQNAEADHGTITQADLMTAFNAAQDITTNFGRAGSAGRIINRYIVPFWNPGVQGASKFVRTFTETKGVKAWTSLVLKTALLGMAPAVLNGLLHRGDDEDEEWNQISDSMKANYYLYRLKDGVWLRIPKGRVLGALSTLAVGATEAIRGDKYDAGELARAAYENIAPNNPLYTNLFATAMRADLFDANSPGTTWYGGDIESKRLQSYRPGERYDESTDILSKWLGGKLNISPKKLSYVLGQYTGVIGDFLLPRLTPKAERTVGGIPFTEPLATRFTLDTATSNTASGDYYDLMDELKWDRNGGDIAAGAAYQYMNHAGNEVSDYYAQIRELENDKHLTDKEKTTLTRELRKELNNYLREVQANVDAYRRAAEDYFDDHPELDYENGKAVKNWMDEYNARQSEEKYHTDEEGAAEKMKALAYREINREVFGAEYALQVYSKDVYDKAKKVNSSAGLDYENYYEYYFGTKDLYSDKDEDGKTISGSKKEKVVAFIDAMDITDEQKDALYIATGYEEKTLTTAPWNGGSGRYTKGGSGGGGKSRTAAASKGTGKIQLPKAPAGTGSRSTARAGKTGGIGGDADAGLTLIQIIDRYYGGNALAAAMDGGRKARQGRTTVDFKL